MAHERSVPARPPRPARGALVALALLALLALAPRPLRAAEASAFLSGAEPGELWGAGFGGTLGIVLFNLIGLEAEGAWQGGQTGASDMWTLTGRAYVGPTFKRFVPYVGLSTGLYRQSLRGSSDTGAARGIFAGAKFRLPLAFFVKAEYQFLGLPDDSIVKAERRYLLGAGIAF
jgi:hypothetical protein